MLDTSPFVAREGFATVRMYQGRLRTLAPRESEKGSRCLADLAGSTSDRSFSTSVIFSGPLEMTVT